jgi:predicted pyridoxine 5'-phosphate oxidase superfamily flavin-nucleotide-binding protein
MSEKSPFHRGERAIQGRAGEQSMADRNSGVLTDTVISGARAFINKQFMVVLGSVDKDGGVWSSILFGKPGFVHTDLGTSILVDVAAAERDATDPFWSNIEANASVGMLFIELGSRRRYRVNGGLIGNHAGGIEIGVREAYPNCPKYIQRRHLRDIGETQLSGKLEEGAAINAALTGIVRQADTLFVASHHPEYGADVSHRGGAPGYISILDDTTLRIPDYPGNCLYNTFGNFEVNPRAGLCIPDFAGNRVVQLSGEATLHWDMPDPQGQTGGTLRFWDFKIDRWLLRDTPRRLEWEYLDASPFNPPVASVAGA